MSHRERLDDTQSTSSGYRDRYRGSNKFAKRRQRLDEDTPERAPKPKQIITGPPRIKPPRRQPPATFNPTPEQRMMVEEYKAHQLTDEEICLFLTHESGECISVNTLKVHFARELAQGFLKAKINVGRSAYQQAVGRPKQFERNKDGTLMLDGKGKPIEIDKGMNPSLAAVMWWEKSRLGFRDTDVPPSGSVPGVGGITIVVAVPSNGREHPLLFTKDVEGAEDVQLNQVTKQSLVKR